MKKKIYLFIFALLTVFCCSPVAGNELTGIINNPNDVGMVMYSKSSLYGDVVMTVMNNTPVTVISDQVEGEGYRWILVRTQDGHEGWVFATGVTDSNGNLLVPSFKNTTQSNFWTYSGNKSSTPQNTSGSQNLYNNGYTNSYSNNSGSTDNPISYGGQTVWIYEKGKRYHSHSGCSGSGDWPVSLQEAQSLGRTSCLKCY